MARQLQTQLQDHFLHAAQPTEASPPRQPTWSLHKAHLEPVSARNRTQAFVGSKTQKTLQPESIHQEAVHQETMHQETVHQETRHQKTRPLDVARQENGILQPSPPLPFELQSIKAHLKQQGVQYQKQVQAFQQQIDKLTHQQAEAAKLLHALAQGVKNLQNKNAQQDLQLVSFKNTLHRGFQFLKTHMRQLKKKTDQNQKEHQQHIEHMADKYNQLLNHCDEKIKHVNKTLDRQGVQLAGHGEYLKHAHQQIKTIQQIGARAPSCEKF